MKSLLFGGGIKWTPRIFFRKNVRRIPAAKSDGGRSLACGSGLTSSGARHRTSRMGRRPSGSSASFSLEWGSWEIHGILWRNSIWENPKTWYIWCHTFDDVCWFMEDDPVIFWRWTNTVGLFRDGDYTNSNAYPGPHVNHFTSVQGDLSGPPKNLPWTHWIAQTRIL